MVAYPMRNGLILGLISSPLLLQPNPHRVSGQTCDEYRFNVSACMLHKGSDTMAACQSCLVSGLNELQGLVPNPQESSSSTTTSASASAGSSSSSSSSANATSISPQCQQASGVLCQILQFDCRESCLLTSCYNTTTMWATCMASSYAPNCNVTCEDALRDNSTDDGTDDNASGGGGAGGDSSRGASWRTAGATTGALFFVVAWGGLAATAIS